MVKKVFIISNIKTNIKEPSKLSFYQKGNSSDET